MNYQKIYQDFIASRRLREADIVGYSEKHHIVPKAMGGDKKKGNIIRLTPDDHFFAHLLLARIHGGHMWAALHAMTNLARTAAWRDIPRLSTRMRFAHIREGLARYYRSINSGPDGLIADKTKYELRHPDGRVVVGNRFELEVLTTIPRQHISALLRGAHKTSKGWYCLKHNPKGLSRSQLLSEGIRSNVIHHLFHYAGGEWAGTRQDFEKEFGGPLVFFNGRTDTVVDGTRINLSSRHTKIGSLQFA